MLTFLSHVSLATYLESEPERKKAQQEAQRAKLQALERKLGIDSKSKGKEKEETSSGVKRRFDDTEYIEQSKDIVDNVRSAVTAGMYFLLKLFTRTQIEALSYVEEEEESQGHAFRKRGR